MELPIVKVKLEGGRLPKYKHEGDAGADVCMAGPGYYTLKPGETRKFGLGFRMAILPGWEVQVRSRSGLASKGIVVANSPGTIDSGYRGPCMVLLHNQSDKPYAVAAGDRIAQFVLKKAPQAMYCTVDDLDETLRGDGGFGSTGV